MSSAVQHAHPYTTPPPDSVAAVEPSAARLPRVNPAEVAEMLRATPVGWAQFAPVTDRDAWKAVADRLGPQRVEELIRLAGARVGEPIPELRSSQWRAFTRTGDRKGYEAKWFQRRAALADLLIGYGLRPNDAVLDAIVDLVWAICEETSWCFPAHDPAEFADPDRPVVDLFASLTAVGLAELSQVLGPVLPAPVLARIEREAGQRVITPYLLDDTWRWLYNRPRRSVNNWAAVCAFGSVGAACYLERDEDRLATLLGKAARSMEDYLEVFDPDGGTSEGTGYWGFGFGSFCQLADLVSRRTGGAWDWLSAPIVERVSTFPLRSRVTVNSWPTFSDSDADVRFNGQLLTTLGARFGLAELAGLADSPVASWEWRGNSAVSTALRSIWAGGAPGDRPLPAPGPSEWFSGLQWLLSRVDPADPDTLALAVKGGHNAEMHNQNDVGSLIVRVGSEDLVVDPGRGLYTRDYFNQHRYEHFVNRSFGHSVPQPAGVGQHTGIQCAARVRELDRRTESDRVSYDLTAVYPDAGLTSLTRTVELNRAQANVVVIDEFAFTAPEVAESGFVTFAEVTVDGRRIVLRGERAALTLEAAQDVEIEVHTETVPLSSGPREASRIALRSRGPVPNATITVTMTPGKNDTP
ncbi:MAG TPA: heparinase II/III family protein [Mycobacteriales bacterium]|jgi:hypothetical protein|nr:heparinase II/III family protein [Mycobacteriales bacterium]